LHKVGKLKKIRQWKKDNPNKVKKQNKRYYSRNKVAENNLTTKLWNRSFGRVLAKLKELLREEKDEIYSEKNLEALTVEDFFRPVDEYEPEEWHEIICELKWNDEDIVRYWIVRHMLGYKTELDKRMMRYVLGLK